MHLQLQFKSLFLLTLFTVPQLALATADWNVKACGLPVGAYCNKDSNCESNICGHAHYDNDNDKRWDNPKMTCQPAHKGGPCISNSDCKSGNCTFPHDVSYCKWGNKIVKVGVCGKKKHNKCYYDKDCGPGCHCKHGYCNCGHGHDHDHDHDDDDD